jgi:protein gp37
MAETTSIGWCDSTFNPWIGCSPVSPGCDHCYAEEMMDARLHVAKWGPGNPRYRTLPRNWENPVKWNRNAASFAKKHKRRRRVFCASAGDWLDNEVPIEWYVDLLRLIMSTPNLEWLLLTKRVGNFRKRMQEATDFLLAVGGSENYDLLTWIEQWVSGQPPAHVAIGSSTVNQPEANREIPKLLRTPARMRFVSIEPCLSHIDLTRIVIKESDEPERGKPPVSFNALRGWYGGYGDPAKLDWVIVGGESGKNARPIHPDWVRSLRYQCVTARVPFFFKQWGEYADLTNDAPGSKRHRKSTGDQIFLASGEIVGAGYRHRRHAMGMVAEDWRERGAAWMGKVGKKLAGRELDGREWSEFPQWH